jgi:UDP:flavonoid glycosyltransferase YjiC (YdhE family)
MHADMSRIVLNTVGSLGDLHPYLAIGRVLAARGHDVVVASHPDYRARTESAGLRFHGVPPALGDFPDLDGVMRAAMNARTGSYYVLRRLCLPYVREATLAVLEASRGADLVVGHPLAFGAVLAAEKLRIPRVHAVLQPLTLFSALDPPLAMGLPLLEVLLGGGTRRWRAAFALARIGTRGWFGAVDGTRAELGLPADPSHPVFDMAASVPTLALFSGVLLDPRAALSPHTLATGFAVHDRGEHGEGLPPDLAEFLDAGPPPLVFTLGSSAVFDAGPFYEQSLLAARALGMRAVLLCGPEGRNRPAGATGDVIAVDYAPHSEVFPRAAAVVHQGGIGTTGQALGAGRPMLVMPCSHDQPDNAGRCRRLGLARVIARRDYRAERVTAELRALLGDPDTARRAREVGERVRAEDGATTAADALEAACRR